MGRIQIVQRLIDAIIQRDVPTLEWLLCTNACLEVWHPNGRMVHWTRARVRNALLTEVVGWNSPNVVIQSWSINDRSITVDFDVMVHDVDSGNGLRRYNRVLTVITEYEQVDMLVLRSDCESKRIPIAISDLPILIEGKKRGHTRACHAQTCQLTVDGYRSSYPYR